MQKYQDTVTGEEWHFEDGVDIAELPNIPKTLTASIIPKPDENHIWENGAWVIDASRLYLIAQAKNALDKLTSPSGTAMRCYIAGIAFPADWQAYRAALVAIVNGTDKKSMALPKQPNYPAGT